MERRLWTKLALSYLLIAVIAVGIAALFFNIALSRQFIDYVEKKENLKAEQMAILLSSIYEKDGCWNLQRVQDVMNMGMMHGREITLLDSEGREVTDCGNSKLKMGPWRIDRMKMIYRFGGCESPLRRKPRPARVNKFGYPNIEGCRIPLFVGDRHVGTTVISPPGDQGIFSSQDKSFQATVNRWLWVVALGAGCFVIIISPGIARHISRPIRILTDAAQNLQNGNLSQRVKLKRKDEIGQLGNAFNHLAESLERQEKYRKKLTENLAHELRTPLANLQTHIEGVIDGILPATPEILTSINEEIRRLGRLVGNIEKLNRAEADLLNLKRKKIDLKILMERTISQFRHQYFEKEVELSVAFPEKSIELFVDQDRILQVINNLLSNALKFTPIGGSVEMSARRRGAEVEISVSDKGIGISEKDLPFIFERFFRGENCENGVRGSGIGLTIAKDITEAHGGRIEVKSLLNHGTEFIIRLPLMV